MRDEVTDCCCLHAQKLGGFSCCNGIWNEKNRPRASEDLTLLRAGTADTANTFLRADDAQLLLLLDVDAGEMSVNMMV